MPPPCHTWHPSSRCRTRQFVLVFRTLPLHRNGGGSRVPTSRARYCSRDPSQKPIRGLHVALAAANGPIHKDDDLQPAEGSPLLAESPVVAPLDAQASQASPAHVPWGWPKIVQVMLAWMMAFYILGGIVVPAVIDLLALDQILDPGPALALLYLSVDVSQLLICVAILWSSLREYKPWATGLFQVRLGGPWVWQVLLWAASFPLVDWLSNVNQNWVSVPGLEQSSFDPRDWQGNLGYIITTLLCAPVWEEVMFRGFLLLSLLRYLAPPVAVVASALLFAAFHFKLHGALPLVALGAMFATVMLSTRNLLAPILLHSMWNLYLWVSMALKPPAAPAFALGCMQLWSWVGGAAGL